MAPRYFAYARFCGIPREVVATASFEIGGGFFLDPCHSGDCVRGIIPKLDCRLIVFIAKRAETRGA